MLDIFSDDENPNIEYIVMPLLREFYDPPFEVVSEAVDFMKQTLTVSSIVVVNLRTFLILHRGLNLCTDREWLICKFSALFL